MYDLDNLRTDRSEKVQYSRPDYPAYIQKRLLSQYPNYSAMSHWHEDLEFIVILSGHMLYNVNGNVIRLCRGEGIFVNAKQLHYGYSNDFSECEFLCILLHSSLLCVSPQLERTYITPILSNTTFPFCIFNQDGGWKEEILTTLVKIYECFGSPSDLLKIQGFFYQIWAALYEHAPKEEADALPHCQHLDTLREMIDFIQTHYKEKIALDDIAQAGKVCKSSCCHIFQSYLNQTPNVYLTNYRLKKSIDLMHITNMSITEICYESGFSGASYYAELFRKYLGISPSQYRQKIRKP